MNDIAFYLVAYMLIASTIAIAYLVYLYFKIEENEFERVVLEHELEDTKKKLADVTLAYDIVK